MPMMQQAPVVPGQMERLTPEQRMLMRAEAQQGRVGPPVPAPGYGSPMQPQRRAPMPPRGGMYAGGGSVSGASRGDGCARKGHTKGRVV